MSYARNEEYLQEFGKRLKELRNQKKMTMQEVASKMNSIPLNSIYRIEKGLVDTSICTVVAIAKALEVPPYKLLKMVKIK